MCKVDVIVDLVGVVLQAIFHISFVNSDGDAVGACVLHLGYDVDFLQRHTSGRDSLIAVNGLSTLGLDQDMLPVCDQWHGNAFLS